MTELIDSNLIPKVDGWDQEDDLQLGSDSDPVDQNLDLVDDSKKPEA